MDDRALLAELAPAAERLLARHLAGAKEWMPHELVPWGRGRDYPEGYEWRPEESSVPAAVRSALFVNLLTEDNLPYYLRDVERMFGRAGALGEWVRRWTAEEARHGAVIRDYLLVTRAVDPTELERGRMAQMAGGQAPEPPSAHDGLAYLCLQELATRIAHRNTGKLLGDDAGYRVMARVAADENLHHLFYRDLAAAALEIDPSRMMVAIADQVLGFAMPGLGIPGYAAHAQAIARAGIYDFQIHHEQILVPIVLRSWAIESLTGLSPEAERARDAVLARIAQIGRVAGRLGAGRGRSAAGVGPRPRPAVAAG
ncbi:MAG: acyl-ACP desaturase [Acidimicrobiales bacterium]